MRPIDADKIIEYCTDACNGTFEARMFVEFMACIDEMPTLEVTPAIYAEWVYDHWCEFKCSNCGNWSNSKPYKGREKYCPECGAKMKF